MAVSTINFLASKKYILGVKELDWQTDNLIICDDSLILISNFTTILIRSICSFLKKWDIKQI